MRNVSDTIGWSRYCFVDEGAVDILCNYYGPHGSSTRVCSDELNCRTILYNKITKRNLMQKEIIILDDDKVYIKTRIAELEKQIQDL